MTTVILVGEATNVHGITCTYEDLPGFGILYQPVQWDIISFSTKLLPLNTPCIMHVFKLQYICNEGGDHKIMIIKKFSWDMCIYAYGYITHPSLVNLPFSSQGAYHLEMI